jgi:hypothetical protein
MSTKIHLLCEPGYVTACVGNPTEEKFCSALKAIAVEFWNYRSTDFDLAVSGIVIERRQELRNVG